MRNDAMERNCYDKRYDAIRMVDLGLMNTKLWGSAGPLEWNECGCIMKWNLFRALFH